MILLINSLDKIRINSVYKIKNIIGQNIRYLISHNKLINNTDKCILN